MICIDIDGTLIRPDHTLSERVISAIRKARDKGVLIVLSTGRMFKSALFYTDELNIKDPIISSNGAYVRSTKNDLVYYEENLSEEDIKHILNVLEKHGVKINWYNHNTMFVAEYRDYVGRYEELSKTLPENRKIKIRYLDQEYTIDNAIKDSKYAIQKGIVFPDLNLIPILRDEVGQNTRIKVVSSGHDNIEFTSYKADKGLGVLALAKAKGIKPEEIIAIGDSENDLAMLKVVGLPVAMGNALDSVKKIAKYITDTNENDGVAKMIEKFILQEG